MSHDWLSWSPPIQQPISIAEWMASQPLQLCSFPMPRTWESCAAIRFVTFADHEDIISFVSKHLLDRLDRETIQPHVHMCTCMYVFFFAHTAPSEVAECFFITCSTNDLNFQRVPTHRPCCKALDDSASGQAQGCHTQIFNDHSDHCDHHCSSSSGFEKIGLQAELLRLLPIILKCCSSLFFLSQMLERGGTSTAKLLEMLLKDQLNSCARLSLDDRALP